VRGVIWRRSLEHVFSYNAQKLGQLMERLEDASVEIGNLSLKDSEILCGILAETLDVGNVRG